MADGPSHNELIEIPSELAFILDRIAAAEMLGSNRHEVATYILRTYLWQQDHALHNIGACPVLKCKHGD